MMIRIALTALLLGPIWPAGAQPAPIYRCGSSYSQTPCANGQQIQADDARSASQKQQADQATRRDADLARALEQDRLAQEKRAAAEQPVARVAPPVPQAAASSAQTPHESARLKPKRLKPGKGQPRDFVAEVPGTRTRLTPSRKARKTPDADPS